MAKWGIKLPTVGCLRKKSKYPSNWKGSETGNTVTDDDELSLMCFNCYDGVDNNNDENQNNDNNVEGIENNENDSSNDGVNNKTSEKNENVYKNENKNDENKNKKNECSKDCVIEHTKKGCPTKQDTIASKNVAKRWANYDTNDDDDTIEDLNVKPKAKDYDKVIDDEKDTWKGVINFLVEFEVDMINFRF